MITQNIKCLKTSIDFANLYKEEAILKVARDCNFIMGSQIERNLLVQNTQYLAQVEQMALDIQPDDEIITTPFATAETIAKPVFDEKTHLK